MREEKKKTILAAQIVFIPLFAIIGLSLYITKTFIVPNYFPWMDCPFFEDIPCTWPALIEIGITMPLFVAWAFLVIPALFTRLRLWVDDE